MERKSLETMDPSFPSPLALRLTRSRHAFFAAAVVFVVVIELLFNVNGCCGIFTRVPGSLVVAPVRTRAQLNCVVDKATWSYSDKETTGYKKEKSTPTYMGEPDVGLRFNNSLPSVVTVEGLQLHNTGDVLECRDHSGIAQAFLFFVTRNPWQCSVCWQNDQRDSVMVSCWNTIDDRLLEKLTFDMEHRTSSSSSQYMRVRDRYTAVHFNHVVLTNVVAFRGEGYSTLHTEIVASFHEVSEEDDNIITYHYHKATSDGSKQLHLLELSPGATCEMISKLR